MEGMTMNQQIQEQQHPHLVYRRVTFSLEAFDLFKDYQRRLESTEGTSLTLGQVLDRVVLGYLGNKS